METRVEERERGREREKGEELSVYSVRMRSDQQTGEDTRPGQI